MALGIHAGRLPLSLSLSLSLSLFSVQSERCGVRAWVNWRWSWLAVPEVLEQIERGRDLNPALVVRGYVPAQVPSHDATPKCGIFRRCQWSQGPLRPEGPARIDGCLSEVH